ncbi:unnamed protein product [Adineta ricciae]|uniref:Essential protein Yae1 N-terminal domain-containing protein n=1 Tax=Adineta ricciae TaxID=249248 RepID=A0A813MMD7_ADIRI|nr:unnamed protein product [Adineta ricciae]
MTNDRSIDPLDFTFTLDNRFSENGQEQGHRYGYQRGFRQGFNRGLDYAWENHREVALIAAYCDDLHQKLSSMNDADPRQKRLVHGIMESCREFRTLAPDVPRYAELLSSVRARYQHLTGSTNHSTDKTNLTF